MLITLISRMKYQERMDPGIKDIKYDTHRLLFKKNT